MTGAAVASEQTLSAVEGKIWGQIAPVSVTLPSPFPPRSQRHVYLSHPGADRQWVHELFTLP